jgi:alcohol dehydrogenase class IV
MEYLARHVCRIDTRNMTRFEAAEAFVNELEKFRNLVGITDIKLGNYGLKEADCKHIASSSRNDIVIEGNARDMTPDDVEALLKSML